MDRLKSIRIYTGNNSFGSLMSIKVNIDLSDIIGETSKTLRGIKSLTCQNQAHTQQK